MSHKITSSFKNQQGGGIHSRILKPNYQKLTSLCLMFLLLFQVIGGVFLFVPKENEAKADAPISWYDSSWLHRKAITINGSTAGVQANYQVSVPVTYNSNMKADFSDIRFTDSDGTTLLNHWMESKTDSSTANFYVKIPSIPASPSAVTIYMYYGNSSAVSASSGDNTFSFFDDFNNPPVPEWQTLTPLPATRADHTAATLNSKIYIIGGYNNTGADPRAEVWAYDPTADSYTQKASLNAARWGPMAVPFGGKIYVFGGAQNNAATSVDLATEVYDSSNNTWTDKNQLPVALRGQGLFGTADSNYIYLFYHNNLYRYDTVDDSYTLLNSTPPNGITNWGTMVNYNNKLYIVGGFSSDKVMIYNLGTSSWEANGTPMPVQLYGMVRENPIIGDNIYIVQGQRNSGEFFSRYWVYNITTNLWTWGSLGNWDADGVAGGVIGNKIYTFGGRRNVVGPQGTGFAQVLTPVLNTKWVDKSGNAVLGSNGTLTKGVTAKSLQVRTKDQVLVTNQKIISKIKYLSGSGFGGLATHANDGLYASALNGYLVPYIDTGANADIMYREAGASFLSLGSSSRALADVWHTYISKYDSSNVTLTRDGTNIISVSNNLYRGGYIHIIAGAGFDMSVDYVAVGNYASPEPSLTAFGSEESPTHFIIAGTVSQTAGIIQTITLTAINTFGATDTSYTGDKTLTLSGPTTIGSNIPTFTDKDTHTVNFGSSGTIHFTNGVATIDIKLYKAESAEIDATDGTNSTNGNASYDLNVAVSPNIINSFNITSSSNITSETPFSLSLISKDASGNTTTNVSNSTNLSIDYGAIDTSSILNTEFQDDGLYTNNITISEIYADRNIILTIRNGFITQTINLSVIGVSHGVGYIPPTKPIIAPTDLISGTVPSNITQIAISRTPDFTNISWQPFDKDKFKNIDQTSETLYVKFRTDQGAVSDIIIYTPQASNQSTTITLNEGDIVKTLNNPDVYVIKYKNNKKYKRLILSPLVFKSYQHLKWENIKIISQEQLDKYTTSNLVKETIDTIIYLLFPNGDIGERKPQDTSINYDPDSVYEINVTDRDSYVLAK